MTQIKKPDWGRRIERAIDLAEEHPRTAEVLNFYRRILDFQRALYETVSSHAVHNLEGPFRQRLDFDLATRQLPALLSLVQRSGPSKLAQQAAELAQVPSEQQRQMLREFLAVPNADDTTPICFFARVLFQPLAESLAAVAAPPTGFAGPSCPVCGSRPLVAVLRPEGDGGKRFLVCSFCMTEWEFRRILCPICGEEDHAKLPRYTADGISAVRVEACDTCHYYLKSIDMTVDGLAVSLVDEIATTPLDIWAIEHGYKKASLNLMGF